MDKIKYQIKDRVEKVVLPDNPGFGVLFTDHVFEMDYNPGEGWHNPVIKPLEDLSIHPATMFIHYGQAVFEGLKAYRTENGDIAIFRPEEHFKRLNRSNGRICIPDVDVDFMLHALKELITVEQDWIPSKRGESLYIRPFIFGTDVFLGVRPSSTYKLIIMLSPVGSYYPEGFQPVKILVQDDYVRTVRKGMGECKTPGNYAASLLAAKKAKELGFTQVLWLDGVEQKYIEEVGTMNIFVRFKHEIATPKITGSVLPGITRKSVIQILNDWEMKVSERLISVQEIVDEYKKGNVLGLFGTGTAAVISKVGLLKYKDLEMTFPDDEFALKLFNEITSIQYGNKPDRYNWLNYLEKKQVEVQ